MTKTVKQRKDELMELLQTRLKDPVNVPTMQNQYNEYRKILYSNGIKNEKVISKHLTDMLERNLPKAAVYSNLKFMHLLRSRLSEEGIPLADAEEILAHVSFDMTDVNEDDDYIGTFALHFAEICAKRYNYLFGENVTAPKLVGEDQKLAAQFNVMKVQLPPA